MGITIRAAAIAVLAGGALVLSGCGSDEVHIVHGKVVRAKPAIETTAGDDHSVRMNIIVENDPNIYECGNSRCQGLEAGDVVDLTVLSGTAIVVSLSLAQETAPQ